MPLPPPKRIAKVGATADDILASRPPQKRTLIREEDYDPGMDTEIFDAPMPMSSDMWDSPVIGGNFYNDDVPVAAYTVPAAAVSRGVHLPNPSAEPLPDPRRRVARVSGGLVHTPEEVAATGGRFTLTPATALGMGAIGLAGGVGLHSMMSGGNEEEQQRQAYMMQQRGY